MELTSLGYRTDLALLRLGGSEVEDRGDYLVVRSPHNPKHWWGNFLVLGGVPQPDEVDGWLDRFAAVFPDARHIALGFDGSSGRVAELAPFADRGLRCEASTVMTASAVHEPPRPNADATYRRLADDDDWAQSVELMAECSDTEEDRFDLTFARAKVATNRGLVEAGHGGWFGAFLDGRLVSQMGLFRASAGIARFQHVETSPSARGQGLAGTLVHHVSRYGLDELQAHTLVMVADPGYLAVRVYRSVGFVDGESQLQAERWPPT